MASKKKLKTVFLRKRLTITPFEFEKRNAQIVYHLSELLDKHPVRTVHSFLPIEKNREVDTNVVVKYLQAIDIQVIISKVNSDDGSLNHFVYENNTRLETNEWGIPEPVHGKKANVKDIELVLIPLVAFDKKGHRIGYGKGYYDRFLAECRPDCIKIGLSLTTPLDFVPYIEDHDIPMNYCVTPVGVYRFQI